MVTRLYIDQALVEKVEYAKVKQAILPLLWPGKKRRKKPLQLGEHFYLFSDYRAGKRRLRSTKCDSECPIIIDSNRSVILDNRKVLTDEEKHQLALDNGFGSFRELFEYFKSKGGYPMHGQLVGWL